MTLPAYSAAVLCGGHSRRMGTDKAHLAAPDTGTPLLLHQLATVAELSPAPTTRWVAARHGQVLPPLPPGVSRLDDDGAAGPLAALVQLLEHMTTDHVLVLPVDAPRLNRPILQALIAAVRAADRGVVARSPDGVQPLVALYPRAVAQPLRSALMAGRLGLRRALAEPAVARHVDFLDFPDDHPFANWNTPTDRLPADQG